jgi:hypothetical protein
MTFLSKLPSENEIHDVKNLKFQSKMKLNSIDTWNYLLSHFIEYFENFKF